MKLYVHYASRIFSIEVDPKNSVQYLSAMLSQQLGLTLVIISKFPGQFIDSGREIFGNVQIGTFFDENDDIYIVRAEERKEQVQPVTKVPVQGFTSLSRYTFYESGKLWVRVNIPLEGIKAVPQHNIKCEFAERSLSVQILDYQGRNYQFSVPRLQCKIDFAKCKYRVSDDKIVLSLRKVKDSDNWFSLFKAKTIGGDDDDQAVSQCIVLKYDI